MDVPLGCPDPTEEWDDAYFAPVRDELVRLVSDDAAGPDETMRVFCAFLVRMDPGARILPAYGAALGALADAIRLRWRPTSSDMDRLREMGRGDPAGAAHMIILMVLDSTAPGPVPALNNDPRYGDRPIAHDYARRLVATTVRTARRILRGPHPPWVVNALGMMERNARDLQRPLPDRLREQWRRVQGGGGMFTMPDLFAAVQVVCPPSPAEVTTKYTRTLDALVLALARTWKMRKSRPNDLDSLRLRADAEDRPAIDLKREFIHLGFVSTLNDREVPQKVRRGNTYLHGGDPIRPAKDVSLAEYFRWLKSESIRRAEQELRRSVPLPLIIEGYTPPRRESRPDLDLGDDRVDALYAAARDDTDKALLDGIADGLSIADASRTLEVSAKTAQKRVERMRKRAMNE